MNTISFPLSLGMGGPRVTDLQVVLQLCLDRGILPDDPRIRSELQREHAEQRYGEATRECVASFRANRHLGGPGEVDEPTANAMNALLREWGLLDQPTTHTEERSFVVGGQVLRDDGLPWTGSLLRAFHDAIRLGEDTTDAEGRYTIRYAPPPGIASVNLRVEAYDEDGTRLKSSDVIAEAKVLEIVDLVVPVTTELPEQRHLEGRVVFDNGLPAENLKLRLYRLDFGGVATQMSETTTKELGLYALPFDLGGEAAGLELRAVDSSGNETPLSKPLHDFGDEVRVIVNLVAPGTLQPLAAEYRRLATDLTPHVGEMKALAGARENAERQDLTVLNRATGWDARLIALAANAEKLSADPEIPLPQEAVYGLLRAGLPSDKLQLAQVNTGVVEQALTKVREAGIVSLSDAQMVEVKTQFETFANKTRLAVPAPGSLSTYGDLLKTSGLNDDAQKKFASVYLNHTRDTDLWKNARDAGLSDEQIQTLQLQGKFAFLASNSEAMTARLMQKQMTDVAQLVEQDFYRAEKWEEEVKREACVALDVPIEQLSDDDKKKLKSLIPLAYANGEVGNSLTSYSEDMARKVRLSYPTHVVGRMIEQDARDNNFKLGEGRPATATFLKKAAAKGFKLGHTPMEKFVRANPDVVDGIDDIETAQRNVKTLQRVYQISPSDEAMPVLLNLGLTSAYDVVALSQDVFLERFGRKFSTLEEAKLVYRKAQQVSSVTYNLFTIAKKLDSEAPVAVISGTPQQHADAKDKLKVALKDYPTMESLFGSMDFCECEHCRSVLSPAAYLVDLLQFIDTEPEVWGNFLAHWRDTHNNQDYTAKYKKPYDALIERRPDIPHIPLTCENTNTALPYIDIVNEILEYYVANGKLEEKAAHDTGETTTAELLAEPQNVIREAYDKLREARYPLDLPFDLWIETARQFCNYFETPLARVLEVFRPSDELFGTTQSFDRFSIFIESLGLSSTELALFVDAAPLAKWHELYGFTTAAEAVTEATEPTTGQRIDLNSAKALSRRLGVTYKEIAEIIQTGFVNPNLTSLGLLYKIGTTIHEARFYEDHKTFYEQNKDLIGKDRSSLPVPDQQRFDALSKKDPETEKTGWDDLNEVQAFEQRLKDVAKEFNVPLARLETELHAIHFEKILVLADPDAGCNFDLTTLCYANDQPADDIAFLKINLFVRLWRKLGWSIEETDRALCAFVPEKAPFDKDHLAKQPLKTALIYLAHLKALDETVRVCKQNRIKLLTLWLDIATTGKNPLYAQLFLTRSMRKSDPVFDHPLGQYLTEPTIKLRDHVLALQGALGLTTGEISRILDDAGKSFDTAELSLPNISLLYRYGLLAKALKLSVRELIVLKQLSGLEPFKPLHPDPLAAIEEDHPFSQTIEFVKIAEEVKDSGLKIEDLDYLLRHRFDETGKYRPNRDATLILLKTLAEGIRAIRAEHAVPDDPGGISEEVLRQKLGLALPADVVERFLAMMNGTAEFTATKTGVEPVDELKPAIFADEPLIRQVSYKEVPHKEQKLTLRGVLFPAQKAELETKFNTVLTAAQKSAFADLLGDLQDKAKEFFEKNLQKQAPNAQPAAGFLDAADFDLLFDRNLALGAGETEQERVRQRLTKLANAFLPFLQERLIRQFVVQTMTAYTGADPVLVESLVNDQRLLAGAKPLLETFAATGERGVSADFFDSIDGSGVRQPTSSTVMDADTAGKNKKDKDGNPLNDANSARFAGYLEVPAPGAYRFYVALDKQNGEAELRFDHLPDPEFLKGTAAADNATLGDQPNQFLELKPGVPYRFTLELKNLNGGQARLLVQGEILPKDSLSKLVLYPLTAIEDAERAVLLLTKALQLIQSLGLSEREIRYLLTHGADFAGLNLSHLPTQFVGDTPAKKVATKERFDQFLRLAGYARVKRDLSNGTDDLIGIFEANGTGDLDKVYPLIAKLTRRDEAMIKASAEALVADPTFKSEKPLVRLWEALQVVERFGVPITSLQEWTRIVNSEATPTQRFEIARELKEAIKARFEPEAWQRVAQPIFDKLRQRQRDALVSHVMHQHGFERMEQLYEYFLIDPGMEPVVQTSRIRLAIASVQLFI
jgi:ABC toxin N-terminal region/Salmonella virulence plasmid 28.1kDa A protein